MQRVTSFQTSDKQLFQDKGEAMLHEFKLEVKGFIQSNNLINRSANSLTMDEVATIIAKNFDPFYEKLKKFNQKMAANRPKTIA